METHQPATMTKPIPDVRSARMLLVPAALVGIAIVVFAVVWFVGRGSTASVSLPRVGAPAAVSEAQLKKLVATTDHPVYWAGKKSGAYELTRTTDGRIYVRYLPSASKVGDNAPNYLTVGTYPQKNAFASIRRAAARPGAISLKIANGRVDGVQPADAEERLLRVSGRELSGEGLRPLSAAGTHPGPRRDGRTSPLAS